jgi:hypothetical protein
MIKLSSVVPTPEWPRANCTNKPIERVVPDWLCVPYHKTSDYERNACWPAFSGQHLMAVSGLYSANPFGTGSAG